MSDEKEMDRSRRKKRRSPQDRENGKRKAVKEKEARAEPKLDNAKATFDARIRKLIQQVYSPASIAKRLGLLNVVSKLSSRRNTLESDYQQIVVQVRMDMLGRAT